MKIQEFAKHLDEPREIGKKKKRLSSSEMKKIKDKAFETYKEMLNYPNYIRNQAPVPANQKDGEHRYYNPDVKETKTWSKKYKQSIDCNNPKGFSQKAHCAGRKKRESIMNIKSLVKETIKEVVLEKQINLFVEKNVPTNPSKWSYYKSQAKKKFDVYPSAYANAWAAKKYKAAGGSWKKG